MLQVDANIGGRQDQKKNNGLRTKTLAVELLMVVGCFVLGYFSATTTTTTAHTRGMSSSNGNSFHIYIQKRHSQNSIQFITHNLTHHKFLHLFSSFKHTIISTHNRRCTFYHFFRMQVHSFEAQSPSVIST